MKPGYTRILVVAYPKSGTTGILRIVQDTTGGTLKDNLRFGREQKSLSSGNPEIEIFKDHSSRGPYLCQNLDLVVIGTRNINSVIESSIPFFEPEIRLFGKNLERLPFVGRALTRTIVKRFGNLGVHQNHLKKIKNAISGFPGPSYSKSEYLRKSYLEYIQTLRKELGNANFKFIIARYESWKDTPVVLVNSLNAVLDLNLADSTKEEIAQNSTFEKHKSRFESEDASGRYFQTRDLKESIAWSLEESSFLEILQAEINEEISLLENLPNCLASV